jgi:hypothetical protein
MTESPSASAYEEVFRVRSNPSASAYEKWSEQMNIMYGSKKVDIPEGQSGNWRVERYTVSKDDAAMERIRSLFSFSSRGRSVPEGTYTRLLRGGTIVMSDTPDEIDDQWEIIDRAKGNVLINGLGLGITAVECLEKPEVNHVTVVEISPDVISLVGTHLQAKYGDKFTIVQADALTWKPPKGSYYDAVWHDIWDNVCGDNLPDMHALHRKYGKRAGWQGSWCRYRCERQR